MLSFMHSPRDESPEEEQLSLNICINKDLVLRVSGEEKRDKSVAEESSCSARKVGPVPQLITHQTLKLVYTME